jgi:octaprenyl-diphosphate synthase
MRQVDAIIAQRLHSDVALVSQIGQYIVRSGGKRLRPVLLLLMSQALGYKGEQRFNLAAIVEFIHTATLLHDDVVDESTLRRGRQTANAHFGNPASVLVGDFLYSRAFQMMVDSGKMQVMKILSEATNVIAEGEVLQLMNVGDAHLSVERYLQVIRSKTAKLFEASAQLAAVLNDSAPSEIAACATYGRSLGTAFQVVDDILDYAATSSVLGKNQGDDLREGKVTLPFIIALSRASETQKTTLIHAIESAGQETVNADSAHSTIEEVLRIVDETEAIQASYTYAAQEAQSAIDALAPLYANPTLQSKKEQSAALDALSTLALDLQNRHF